MSMEYFQFLKWRIKYPSFMKTFNSWIPTNRIPYFDPSMTNWFVALQNNIKDPQNLLSPCPICNAKMVVAWNTYFAIIHLTFHSGLNSWPQSSQTSEINTHGHRSCCAGPTKQLNKSQIMLYLHESEYLASQNLIIVSLLLSRYLSVGRCHL